MSTFRDLVLHQSERPFTMDEVAKAIEATSLRYLGFRTNAVLSRYFKEAYPRAPRPGTLDQWKHLEEDNPGIFNGMYQFWCQKTG